MATHSSFKGAFRALYSKLRSVQSSLPGKIAKEGTRFWISNFDLSGFTDVAFSPWQKRKEIKGKSGIRGNKRKLLVKSGALRRAANNSAKEITFRRVVWQISKNEIPYAARHNYGLHGMPERRFFGDSLFFRKRIKRIIIDEYKKAFNRR